MVAVVDGQRVQDLFPGVDPSSRVAPVLSPLDRDQVEHFDRGLLGREMAPPHRGFAEPGIERLDGVGGVHNLVCGGRKLCRAWSGDMSVFVDESVALGRFHDLKVALVQMRRRLRSQGWSLLEGAVAPVAEADEPTSRLGWGSAAAMAPSRVRSPSLSDGRSICRRRTESWWRNTTVSRSLERPERTASWARAAMRR